MCSVSSLHRLPYAQLFRANLCTRFCQKRSDLPAELLLNAIAQTGHFSPTRRRYLTSVLSRYDSLARPSFIGLALTSDGRGKGKARQD